ncbi:hypothetical protein [Haloarchaeobius salinus]|uniref:hypothetical protein n=1 Tax=Haloarchaeobius salinus TaxID=1198298 RepID=UPI00210C6D9C|nr:hypothetical protein [Haloarchaeobius salinus]
MSRRGDAPTWYSPGEVQSTVRRALSNNVDLEKIVSVLGERELDNVQHSRVEAIIENVSENTEEASIKPHLSQPPSTKAEPREVRGRRLSADDFEFFSNREAARVLGLVLESFDGNTLRMGPHDQVESDLVWNRQGGTIALLIVPTTEEAVDSHQVDALLEGQTVPEDRRSPSELAVVTNGSFTDQALGYAETNDIRCYDGGHLEAWLQRVLVPMDAVGTVLEEGEDHDGPILEIVDIPSIPAPRATIAPLEIEPVFEVEMGEEEPGPKGRLGRDDPLKGTDPDTGQTGTLYADPEEDGEYGAFEDYLESI